MSPLALALVSLLAGCGPRDDDTAGSARPFCIDLSDGDDWRFLGSGGGSTTGSFTGRLLTDVSEDPGDPSYVANVEYTVENVDVGGTTQERARTDGGGYFSGSGAAGHWRFQAGVYVLGRQCSADTEFEVEVGRNTEVCAVLHCE